MLFLAPGSSIMPIILIVVMVGALLLFSILPQKKRQKQAQQMMSGIRKGDKIKTIGGFIGTIYALDDATNSMVINLGTEEEPLLATLDKSAIYVVLNAQNRPVEDVVDEAKSVMTEEDAIEEERKAKKQNDKDNDIEKEDNNNIKF